MTGRIYNFNPGPATLPLPVLEEVKQELLNYKGSGMSILEISHRSKQFEEIITESENLLKEIMKIPHNYRVLFLQGGASTQFYMIPLNYLKPGTSADYIITGSFADKAYKEALKLGKVNIAANTENINHTRIVKPEEINLGPSPAYLHFTSNNTIFGTQWKWFPQYDNIDVICDMSSDILSRKIKISNFALIYAGAQKNLGPAGVTIVIIRNDMLGKTPSHLPNMLRYDIHAEKNSLYNTPPVYAIYMVNLVLKWIKSNGGLTKIEQRNKKKASYIYNVIDKSGGFYIGHAEKESRSNMNITFRLPNDNLEKNFFSQAEKNGLVGLRGHRTVGGVRVSIYNAMDIKGCETFADFMKEFLQKKG